LVCRYKSTLSKGATKPSQKKINISISFFVLLQNVIKDCVLLTKYVVGAKTNPPKKLRSPPKKGNVIARNMVIAAYK
jgi:hypothetical protein